MRRLAALFGCATVCAHVIIRRVYRGGYVKTIAYGGRWAIIGKKHHKDQPASDSSLHPFAHESEREFANLLNFYQIQWQYEPRTFPLERDSEGNVLESFTPDFYLPELDLYIELTTLKQSLVTKKNRKLRRLRELYPEVNIKLLYRRDYRSLMLKYGLSPDVSASPSQQNAAGSEPAANRPSVAGDKPEDKLSPE